MKEMTLNEYQFLANRTSNPDHDQRNRLIVAALGLTGEAGEVADHIKKYAGHGHSLDKSKLIEEIGDELWYIAEIASALNITLEDIAKRNIEKLKKRYPDGFSSERSINRTI